MYGLSIVTAPTTEPVSLQEARDFLRIGPGNAEPSPSAPTVALAGLGAGNVNSGAHSYLITFVTADGETEAGQQSSSVTTSGGNGQVALSAIPLGGALVTSRNIYRTAAGGSTYKLLAALSNNTATTYADNIADSALGVSAPSTNTTADALLTALLKTAKTYISEITGLLFITQTWDLWLDEFPCGNEIDIPLNPVQSITGVYSYDDAGVETEFASTNYHFDNTKVVARVVLAQDAAWPSSVLRTSKGVRVRFIGGFGSAASSVPTIVTTAIKMYVDLWYRNPESIGQGSKHIDALLFPLRAYNLI